MLTCSGHPLSLCVCVCVCTAYTCSYRKSSEGKEGVYKARAGNGTDNKSCNYCCCGPQYGSVHRHHKCVYYNKYRTNQHTSNRLSFSLNIYTHQLCVIFFIFFFRFYYIDRFLVDLRRPPPIILSPLDSLSTNDSYIVVCIYTIGL